MDEWTMHKRAMTSQQGRGIYAANCIKFGAENYVTTTTVTAQLSQLLVIIVSHSFALATTMPKRHSVMFATSTLIVRHISTEDMTDDEIASTWILPGERQTSQFDAQRTIRYMQRCPSQVTEQHQMCGRGLEHHRTLATKRAREAIKRSVCDAVLDEQEDQLERSRTPDPDAIRRASTRISRASTERALRLAEIDAEHVRSFQKSDTEEKTKTVNARSTSRSTAQGEDEIGSLSRAISRRLVMTRNRARTKLLAAKKSTNMNNIVDASLRNRWSTMAA